MTKRFAALGGACLAMLAALPAQATVYATSWTGTVTGTDTDGWFGTPGAVLTGQSFTMTFNIDAATDRYSETAGNAPYRRYDQIRSNTLTIGGVTLSQTNGMVDRSLRQRPNGLVISQQYYTIAEGDRRPGGIIFMLSVGRTGSSLFGSLDPLSAFTYTSLAGDTVVGSFTGKSTRLSFQPTAATFAAVVEPPVVEAGVPEPSAWAMMIGGFGLVGVAVRRRRTAFAARQVAA